MKLNGCWRKKQFKDKIRLSCGKHISLIPPCYIIFKQVRSCSDFKKNEFPFERVHLQPLTEAKAKSLVWALQCKEQEVEVTCSKFHKISTKKKQKNKKQSSIRMISGAGFLILALLFGSTLCPKWKPVDVFWGLDSTL